MQRPTRRRIPVPLIAVALVIAGCAVLANSTAAGAAGNFTGPAQFSVARRAGAAGHCTYADGRLLGVSARPPLAQMRFFWTTAAGGRWAGQSVGYVVRLFGLRAGRWVPIAASRPVGIVASRAWKRLPAVPALVPKGAFAAYRLTETLIWRRPAPTVRGQTVEGRKTIVLGSYWDGARWSNVCPAPPGRVFLVAANATDGRLSLSWHNPAVPISRVVVRYRKGPAAPLYRFGGQPLPLLTRRTAQLLGLPAATAYSFAFWIRDANGHWSTRWPVTARTRPLPGPVGQLNVQPVARNDAPAVALSWANPPSPDLAGIWICRGGPGQPAPANPAQCPNRVALNAATSYVDTTNLQPGRNYAYSVFTHDFRGRNVPGVGGGTMTFTRPTITTSLGAAQFGQPYTANLSGSGTGGLVWSLVGGPDWMTVGPGGAVSGTPGPATSDPSSVDVTVKLVDRGGNGLSTTTVLPLPLDFAPGDVNGDGVVDCTDQGTIVSHLGQPGPWHHTDGDLTGDTAVDQGDLDSWTANANGLTCP